VIFINPAVYHKHKVVVSHQIWIILRRSKLQNFLNWPVEFGKIFHEKLWALVTDDDAAANDCCSIFCVYLL